MKKLKLLLVFSLIAFSCQENGEMDNPVGEQLVAEQIEFRENPFGIIPINQSNPNARVESGTSLILHSVSYITTPGSNQMGKTIFFTDRGNKQLETDFSPLVPWDGTPSIDYFVDDVRAPSTIDFATAKSAINRAASTWDAVNCSDFGLSQSPSLPFPLGFIALISGYPSLDFPPSEVNHLGWLPADFWEDLAPGGSGFILGATFTLTYVDGDGAPLDTNNDGKTDVAFTEIYYNDYFTWGDGSNDPETIDVETIALHEMGHGLSQAHFGEVFVTKSGKVQFAPRAVMNAAYSGIQTQIGSTDKAGHCSIWGNWPNK